MPVPAPMHHLACLALLCGACASGPTVRTAPPKPLTDTWALAVYPVTFRFRTNGFESFSRGVAIAGAFSRDTGRLVYGPGEFKIDDPDSDDAVRSTNLMVALRYSRDRRPENVLAIRTVVAQRVKTGGGVQFVTKDGKNAGGHREEDETDVVVHMDLLNVGERKVVAEVEGIARADPFSVDVEVDPFPDVTRLTKVLETKLVEIAGLERETPAPPLGLTVAVAPAPALAFAPANWMSFNDELAKLDALEQDVQLLGVLQHIEKEAPRQRARLYKSAKFGLVVLKAEGRAAAAGLMTDDLITFVNGEPAHGLHVLERHLTAGPASLKVKRAGEEMEFHFE